MVYLNKYNIGNRGAELLRIAELPLLEQLGLSTCCIYERIVWIGKLRAQTAPERKLAKIDTALAK